MNKNGNSHIDFSKQYLTYCNKVNDKYHRAKYIIHGTDGYHVAEFNTKEALDLFLNTLGIEISFVEKKRAMFDEGAEIEYYSLSLQIVAGAVNHEEYGIVNGYFWHLSQLPEGVMPIPLLSNGSIVTGYFLNMSEFGGEHVYIYRPNPNAKEVYKPLPTKKHIEFVNKYWLF